MPPAAMSIGCTCRRTTCSISASVSARAVAAALSVAKASAAVMNAVVHRIPSPPSCSALSAALPRVPQSHARQEHPADEAAGAIGGLREHGLGAALVPRAAGAVRDRTARRVDADAAFEQATDARPLMGVPVGAAAGRKGDAVAAQEQF